MSQAIFTSINPATTSGNQLAIILNDFKDAIVSGLSGTSRPAALQAGGFWVDITNDPSWVFKIYNGTTDTPVFTINTTTGTASISSADTLFEVAKVSDDAVGPIVRLLKERIAAGGQTVANDVLGEVQFSGTQNDGTNVPQARIKAIATQSTTSANQGSSIIVETKNTGSASFTEVMRATEGKIGIGTTAPAEAIHVVGNARVEKASDDTIPAKVNLRKKRVAGGGQTLTNDIVGRVSFSGTDNAGVEAEMGTIEVLAAENTTAAAMGSKMSFKIKNNTLNTFTEKLLIDNGGVTIPTLTVTNFFATNSTLGNVTETADASILVNKGGNTASADAVNSGFEIEIGGGTNAKFGYDSTKASKFVLGNVGALKEVADVSSVQTFTNKTLTAPVINNGTATGTGIITPSRLDAKQDTLANLQTYALTAANGQLVYATDTKQMFQVLDTALAAIGGGGGGADTFLYLDASEQLTGWALGDNATFLGGGTFTGTFVKETAAPLNGSASYKYTQNTSSLDEYIASPIFPVAKRFRGGLAAIVFPYNYNGTSSDIEPIVWDVTNGAKLTSTLNLLPSSTSTNISVYKAVVTIPATCTQIRVGFQVKALNNGKILQFDDIVLTSDIANYADISGADSCVRLDVANGFGSTATMIRRFLNVRDNFGPDIWYQDSATMGASFTIMESGIYLASYSGTNDTGTVGLALTINATGSELTTDSTAFIAVNPGRALANYNGATTNDGSISWQGYLPAGTVIRPHTSGNTNSVRATRERITIARIGKKNNVIVTPSDTVSTDTLPLTYAASGVYDLTTLANAPVGTFITYTTVAGGNTRAQTSTAPTQTVADMNANGIRIVARPGDTTSLAGTPHCFAIQIGKGFKGISANLFKSTGKSIAGSLDYTAVSSLEEVGFTSKEYNEVSGIMVIDAGVFKTTSVSNNRYFSFSDNSNQGSGYVVVTASKSPALIGLPNLAPKVAYLYDKRAPSVNGGSSVVGAQTRTVNTLVNRDGFVTSLTSNQFTLPAGRYTFDCSMSNTNISQVRPYLYNVTDSTIAIVGLESGNANIDFIASFQGEVVISSPKVFEVREWCSTASATFGLGYAAGGATVGDETFLTLCIQKVS